MKLIISTALLFASFVPRAQDLTAPDFPWDDVTNKVSYTDVVEATGVTAADLFKRLESWFNTFYTNPTNVIQSKDTEKFSITGQHRFDTYLDNKGEQMKEATMQYAITVACKEGRYKYTITDIVKYQSPKIPIEDYLKTDPPADDVIPMLAETDSFFVKLTDSLFDAMTTEPKTRDDDDW